MISKPQILSENYFQPSLKHLNLHAKVERVFSLTIAGVPKLGKVEKDEWMIVRPNQRTFSKLPEIKGHNEKQRSEIKVNHEIHKNYIIVNIKQDEIALYKMHFDTF